MISTESFVSLWEQEEIFTAQPLTARFTCTLNGEAVDYLIELLAPIFYGGGGWRGELSPSQQQCMATSACRLQMFLRANDLTYQIRIVDGTGQHPHQVPHGKRGQHRDRGKNQEFEQRVKRHGLQPDRQPDDHQRMYDVGRIGVECGRLQARPLSGRRPAARHKTTNPRHRR